MKIKRIWYWVLGLILSMTLGTMSSVKAQAKQSISMMTKQPVMEAQLLAQTSGSCVSGSPYTIKAGDTLANIAQQKLGDSNRWTEITKPDGTIFTQQSAAGLLLGQVVCLPGASSQPTNSGFANIVSRDNYEKKMFPNRDNLYTYDALLAAVRSFPKFCNEGSNEQRKREAAAFLANIAHETTGGWPQAPGGPYAWGLRYVEELKPPGQYCDMMNTTYKCVPGRSYHGRGPIQLSWNFNYGAAGKALTLDLLTDPDKVKSDGVIAFKTALWFWMTPQSPKPSAHTVMSGGWKPDSDDLKKGRKPGFGMTINIINGGQECGDKPKNADAKKQVEDRVGFYRTFTNMLGVNTGDNLYCNSMKSY